MKPFFVVALLLSALVILTSACNMSALPTPTPLAPTPLAPTPTLTPTLTPTPTSTPTYTPIRTSTPTFTPVPPSPTSTPSPTATATPQPTEAPTEEPAPTTRPTQPPWPTRPPSEPTSTAEADSTPEVASTPTESKPRPPTPTAEPAPAGGWSEVARGYPGKKRVALTFDAGGEGETIPQILNTLRERNIHITMFITGKFAEQHPEGVIQAAADGHEIANHTYSHQDSVLLTDDALIEELDHTENILYNLTGLTTKPYWRPPFGSRNNHVLNVAVKEGYRSIYWTLDSLDSVGQPKTADFIFNRVTNTPNFNLDGAIILQHFGSQASADALPRILDRLQEMGYTVVTISDILTP